MTTESLHDSRRPPPRAAQASGATSEDSPRFVQLPTNGERSSSRARTASSAPIALPSGAFDRAGQAELLGALVALFHRITQQPTIALDAIVVDESGSDRVTLDVATEPDASISSVIDAVGRGLGASSDARRGGAPSNVGVTLQLRNDVESSEGAAPSDRHDLHLTFTRDGETRLLAATYDAELFAPAAVERILESYGVLLEGARRDRATPIDRLPVLGPAELDELRASHGGGAAAYPPFPVHRTFEGFAKTQPEAIAVTYHGQRWTYADLEARSNQLAWHLVECGVGPDVVVAVCIPPSPDILVAMLAIWKVRGIYLPVDPTHPEAHVARMLDEVKPWLVLTTSAAAPLTARFPQLRFDADADLLGKQPTSAPNIVPSLGDAAYIFYTSGTTGRPKGVVATQANLVQYVHSAVAKYGFSKDDVFVSLARYTFSISMFELVSPLCCGGGVCILDRDEVLTPERLVRALEQVTVVHAGPSLLGSLFRHLRSVPSDLRSLPGMRHASSGGDIVPPSIMEEMKRVFPNAELFVIYGCTEVSCMGTTFPIRRDAKVSRTFVGKPFPNVTVRLLDASHNLVPFGVVGEIWFAGNGVTRGYLDRPELTAAKYVEIDGLRFYRTGDMGRMHSDGHVEILGRRDFQVQLRGIRIELAGIEQMVQELGLAAQCVVVARPMGDGELRLVAFVVKPSDERVASFRRALAHELPDYMLPSHLVVLDALPLTANGKVDRNRLKDMPWDPATARDQPSVPPANDRERKVAEVFARVLGLGEVGVDDNFFDLGGDSLLGVVALAEIGRAIGTALPPHVLFENGTVRGLANLVPTVGAEESKPILLSRSSSAPALFMLSGIHLYRELAKRLEGRCSSYGVFAPREVEALAPVSSPHAVEDLARDYVAIIRRHDPVGPYRLLGFSFAGLVAYEVARQLRSAGAGVRLLVLVDSTLPEWTGGWRFRMAQLRRAVSAPSRDVAAFVFRRLWEKPDPTGLRFRQYADDERLGPLEERRDITNRGAAEHYMRRLRPFEGKATLIISGERLRRDPLKSPSCGWGPYIPSLDVHTLETDHFRMMDHEPYVSQMAAVIAADVEREARDPARSKR